jgi:hypothetical protein
MTLFTNVNIASGFVKVGMKLLNIETLFLSRIGG